MSEDAHFTGEAPVTLATLIALEKAPNHRRVIEAKNKLSKADLDAERPAWQAAEAAAIEKDFANYRAERQP